MPLNKIRQRVAKRSAAAEQSLNVVQINGKKFVADLYWHPLSRVRGYMQEAREIGKTKKYDIVAIRRSKQMIQAGFVRRDAHIEKGMYSLAAALAGSLGDNWCGAFRLSADLFVVCAVRDGIIAPGQDRIVDESGAKHLLSEALSYFDEKMDRVYAPAEWQMAQEELDLATVLNPKDLKKDYKLQQLKFGMSPREVKALALGGVVFVALLAGGLLVKKHYDDIAEAEATKEQLRRDAELNRLNETARKKLVMEALAHPWAKLPNPTDFLAACETSLGALPLSIAGWNLKSGDCTATRAIAKYTRQKGYTQLQFEQGANQFAQIPVAFESADVGLIAVGLSIPVGGDDEVLQPNAAQRTLISRFQEQDPAEATISVVGKSVEIKLPPPPPGIQPSQQEKPPEPTWSQFDVDLKNIGLSASDFLGPVTKMPGLRITSLHFDLNAETAILVWSLTGNLYAQK